MKWQAETINGNRVIFSHSDDESVVEYLASRDAAGKFHVNTHKEVFTNIPFVGEFDNYSDMSTFFNHRIQLDVPVVCHVKYSEPNAYMLLTPRSGNFCIRIEE